MSQSIRQSELFASKDWTVLYQAFSQINFNASDPTTINQSLREYLRVNYPEDFNDWIESSEFVAIIDLLSWLSGILAFKTDINAHENFLEVAGARESILRLARFLSYNPRRNLPARGLVKLVEVSTDDDVDDSTGQSLTGVKVQWNDPDDPDWFERFSIILSNAFINTNPFGTPLKSGFVNSIKTHLYRCNSVMGENNFGFNSRVGGEGMDFEICNGDFDDLGTFNERIPDNDSAFHLYYRNDGNGNNSPRTGFFMLFKQGTMVKQNFRIDSPIENMVLDLDYSGVNETDVWVQTVSDTENVLLNWEKVPAIFSENITFNSISPDIRNIFSVITRDLDQVSLRFADGIFGAAPIGNLRVWHRVSNGQQYSIKPFEINRITQNLVYYNSEGVKRNIRLVFSLQEPISNAAPRETDEQIRQRASSTYAAQNRMVNGEDYNTFPLASNLATKLKAVNRVYSGHTRHLDLNDPTSTYQDVNVFSDDGILYKENANIYQEVPESLNRTAEDMVSLHLQPLLREQNIKSFVDDILTRSILPIDPDNPNDPTRLPPFSIPLHGQNPVAWTQSTTAKYSSSGTFNNLNGFFRAGTLIKFHLPDTSEKWVSIADVSGDVTLAPLTGLRGPVLLSEAIPTGSYIVGIIPAFSAELGYSLVTEAVQRFQQASQGSNSFSIWYSPITGALSITDYSTLDTNPIDRQGVRIRLATVEYVSGLWKLSGNGMRYVFESERKVKWYYDGERVVDTETGLKKNDTVTILRCNSDLNYSDGRGIGNDFSFNITDLYRYGDGTTEPRRIQIDYTDIDSDGAADNPESYTRLVEGDKYTTTLFWRLGESFGNVGFIPLTNIYVFENIYPFPATVDNKVIPNNTIGYSPTIDKFFLYTRGAWQLNELSRREFRIARGRGGNVAAKWVHEDESVVTPKKGSLYFHWKHYAPSDHRIDPSITNIIDMFVLTTEYDFLTRQWIANGAKADEVPTAISELDLRLTFQDYDNFKVFSDQLVWRPVTYKYLFGSNADKELRAQFKVVKLASSTLADGEIKSRLIRAVNEFFDLSQWDFGETFFFTELAAYIHQKLANVIGSVVIVPTDDGASFGDNFEVRCRSDEIFISTAQVSDVLIINSNTASNLRIR